MVFKYSSAIVKFGIKGEITYQSIASEVLRYLHTTERTWQVNLVERPWRLFCA